MSVKYTEYKCKTCSHIYMKYEGMVESNEQCSPCNIKRLNWIRDIKNASLEDLKSTRKEDKMSTGEIKRTEIETKPELTIGNFNINIEHIKGERKDGSAVVIQLKDSIEIWVQTKFISKDKFDENVLSIGIVNEWEYVNVSDSKNQIDMILGKTILEHKDMFKNILQTKTKYIYKPK